MVYGGFYTWSRGKLFTFIGCRPGQGTNASSLSDNVSIDYTPEAAKKYAQSLNVYFFKQYKILIRKVVEHCRDAVLCDDSTCRPSNRFHIIRIHSVCHHQLSHPRFRNMLRYAWQAASYDLDEPVTSFENVSQILLEPLESPNASCSIHGKYPIMRCAYCDHFICWKCFHDPIHLHL